jgi:hypothetical protein
VPDVDALEEKPDPEPGEYPDDAVEGVHYSPLRQPGDWSPSRTFTVVASVPGPCPGPAAPFRRDDAIASCDRRDVGKGTANPPGGLTSSRSAAARSVRPPPE